MTASFEEHTYNLNVFRYVTLSVVVVAMNAVTVFFYLCHYYVMAYIDWVHILICLFAIAVELSLFAYYVRLPDYNCNNLLVRNSDVLVYVVIMLLELAQYSTGPKDIGGLLRVMSLPFILSTCVIMKQTKVFTLSCLSFLVFSLPFVGMPQNPSYIFLGYVANTWFVIFPCVVMISGFVYSGFVQMYIDELNEAKLIRGLEGLNTQLDLMSRRDKLTGLSNRRDFESFVELTWDNEAEKDSAVSIIAIGIDYFHLYNDRFGNMAADNSLVIIAKAMQNCFTGTDHMFARKSGDKFVVIMYGEQHDRMVSLAENMRVAVENLQIENPDSKESLYITISCGLATMPVVYGGFDKVEEMAEECLQLAKGGGRNRVIHFNWNTGKYLNIDGRNEEENLVVKRAAQVVHENFDQLNDSIKKLGLECSFIYSKHHEVLEFSEYAQESLEMPSKVISPSIEKLVEVLPIVPEDRLRFIGELRNYISWQQNNIELELHLMLRSTERVWLALRMNCLYDNDGSIMFAFGNLFQISNILEIAKYLDNAAMVNSITGLPNRKSFYRDMSIILSKRDCSGYVVMFDVHNFKSINGIFGHNVGDKTIKKIAEVFTKMARRQADIYHYTVDQFILVFQNTAESAVSELIQRTEKFFLTSDTVVDDIAMRIQFKMGSVMFSKGMHKLDDLMVNLDVALQKAKRDHFRSFHQFNDNDKAEYLKRISLEKDIFESVHSDFKGFSLHYQPLHAMPDRNCVGAEALLRWTNAGTTISPAVVIPILESSGLIKEVGEWILNTACKQCAEWIAAGAPMNFYIHVNLSIIQIDKKTFVNGVLGALNEYGLLPYNIVLEITESMFITETVFVMDVLHLLRENKIRISVDDFGTGYSSLSYLRTLPADQIKIDRFFLNDIEKDESVQNILRSIAELIDNMGFSVCIEGVETEEQASFLKNLPISLMQGYLLGRPMPPQDFAKKVLKIGVECET